MVLENASASSEADFSESQPASDIDPYSSSNPPYTATNPGGTSYVPVNASGSNQIFVNLNQLPRRWSLIGEKQHPQFLIDGIQDSCRFANNVLRRPVNQQEADAFAYHFAHSLRIGSYGTPIGVTLGTIQSWRKRQSYRFPGWTPFTEGGRFSADVFGPLRGQMARTAWQSLRLSAYWIVGATLGQIFFGSYALSVSLAGRTRDPRLKDFTQALQQRVREGATTESLRRPQDESGTTQSETFEQMRQRRQVQQAGTRSRQQQQQQRSKSTDDDMSPTGGAFGNDYTNVSSDTGLMSDEQMRQQEIGQRADAGSSATANTDTTFDMNKAAPQRPSAGRQSANQGNDRGASDQSPSSRQSGGGSAWDRLRQGAAAGGQGQSGDRRSPPAGSGMPARVQGEQRSGSTMGDSFSFSESDEERQLAKSEAQKEFDKRIEREREGRDFNDRGGGGRRY